MPNNIRNFNAESLVEPCRIVKFGATEGTVAHAAAITDKSFGITTNVGAAEGERVDVIYTGPAVVETGDGTINPGDPLTSDAQGRAIKADTSSGGLAEVIGYAVSSSSAAGTLIDAVISKMNINSDISELLTITGNVEDLETVEGDLVGAINEVNTKLGDLTVSGVTASGEVTSILAELASRIDALEGA
jgi:hypothetical protein